MQNFTFWVFSRFKQSFWTQTLTMDLVSLDFCNVICLVFFFCNAFWTTAKTVVENNCRVQTEEAFLLWFLGKCVLPYTRHFLGLIALFVLGHWINTRVLLTDFCKCVALGSPKAAFNQSCFAILLFPLLEGIYQKFPPPPAWGIRDSTEWSSWQPLICFLCDLITAVYMYIYIIK